MASPSRTSESSLSQQGFTEENPESSAKLSSSHSKSGSHGNPSRPAKERQQVRWGIGEALDENNQKSTLDIRDESRSSNRIQPAKPKPRPNPYATHSRNGSSISGHPFPTLTSVNETQDQADFSAGPSTSRPQPLPTRLPSSANSLHTIYPETVDITEAQVKEFAQRDAQEKAQMFSERIARNDRSHQSNVRSTPGSKRGSPLKSPPSSPPSDSSEVPLDITNIPLKNLETRRKYGIEDDTDDEEENENPPSKKPGFLRSIAEKFLKSRGLTDRPSSFRVSARELDSGQTTPKADRERDGYVPRPKEYRAGVLTTLMKLYDDHGIGSALGMSNHPLQNRNPEAAMSRETLSGANSSQVDTPLASGATTPKQKRPKWYHNSQASSTGSIANLINSSSVLAQPGGSAAAPISRPSLVHRSKSSDAIASMLGISKKGTEPKVEESIHIRVHIAEIENRQKYLLKLCRALMNYGAPTHRLEGELNQFSTFLWDPGH